MKLVFHMIVGSIAIGHADAYAGGWRDAGTDERDFCRRPRGGFGADQQPSSVIRPIIIDNIDGSGVCVIQCAL